MLADGRRLTAGARSCGPRACRPARVAACSASSSTRGGRIVVDPDLSVPGHPEVFAIGDIAAAPRQDGTPLPQVAQPAIQGGRHAARQIVAASTVTPTEPFRYHDKGSMATIGRNDAITEFPIGLRLHGRIGWLAVARPAPRST